MPGYMKPSRTSGASEFEQFAHDVFKDIVDGRGTVHARRAKLLQVLTDLAKENYDAGVADGKKEAEDAAARAVPVQPPAVSAPEASSR